MSRPTRADVARGRALVTGDPKDVKLAIREQRLADQIAAHVARVVSEAPPLTLEQRSRIARLLAVDS